ncbi:MAG: L-rhamnose mutarotase [Puia sp.]|nr:L-rhamnose mutarotase [Puia sp.]
MRYCMALDLKDDPKLIAEYEYWHQRVAPEIKKSIWEAGITDMQLFRFRTRLFMIMETDETFSFERKTAMDKANPKVQEWEAFVAKFQQEIPGGKEGEKWQLMDPIFGLND